LNIDKFIDKPLIYDENVNHKHANTIQTNNSDFLFLQESSLSQPFINEAVRNFDISKSITGFKGYNRVESLPSLNGDSIDILR
jgi:hypothetical protein